LLAVTDAPVLLATAEMRRVIKFILQFWLGRPGKCWFSILIA